MHRRELESCLRAIKSGQSVAVIGEAGSGKSTLLEAVKRSLKRVAVATASDAAIDSVEAAIALQMGIDTKTEKGANITIKALRREIQLNAKGWTFLLDDAHHFPKSLLLWLEILQSSGVVLVLFAIDNPRKSVYLKSVQILLSSPSDLDIRDLMQREAIALNLKLSPSRLAQLQNLAGKNLMLAKKVIQEEALGLHQEAGEHTQYFDIAPFVAAALCALGIVRFIGLGLGDRSLYIVGGVAMLVGLSFKYIGRGINQRERRLGK